MKNQNLFNRKSLKFFRSSLRNKSTSAEAELWNVIELDGNPHGEYNKIEKEKKRDQ
jgi:very-short-patch-repair endonuclease